MVPSTAIHRWFDVVSPRGLVHVLHGMAEHGGRYARLASALNAAGFIVWAHDHRGHGLNPTPPVGLGHFADADGWRAVLGDAWDVSAELRSTYPGLPLFLFAHSMGSFMGQALMATHGPAYRGVVLCGTSGAPDVRETVLRGLAHAERQARGFRTGSMWVQDAVFGHYNRQFAPARTPFDWLSRDDREVDLYRNDSLCGFTLTTQSWVDFLDGKAELGTKPHAVMIPKALPILVIAGSCDPVGDDLKSVTRLLATFEDAGLSNVCRTFYDGARHELVNETNRNEVTRDVLAWLETQVRR